MAEPRFQQTQKAFAAYIRDPDRQPLPDGVSPVRMAAYRDLFFNNIENFIATGFPVLKSTLPEADWRALVRDFYARHRCRTPLFVEIAREFVAYVTEEREAEPQDPAFLQELAHYEWVELALAVDPAEAPQPGPWAASELLDTPLDWSPLAWRLVYRFPVHRIGPEYQPREAPPEPTCLVVYRDREDRVRFMEANPVTLLLLEQLETLPELTPRAHLQALAERLPACNPTALEAFGVELLASLQARSIVGRVVST